jgi:ankyrin repeat protein
MLLKYRNQMAGPQLLVEKHRTVGFVDAADSKGPLGYQSMGPEDHQNASLLGIMSQAPLKLFYAQHLFTVFMWSVANTMTKPFSERTELRTVEEDDIGTDLAWQNFTLHNTNLSKLAKDIEETGLGDLETIYHLIIPPLSLKNKLPQPTVVIHLAHEKAKQCEQQGQWKEAADIYLWLFGHARVSPPGSYIRIRAIAFLMEWLNSLQGFLEVMEQNSLFTDDNHFDSLKNLRLEVLSSLKHDTSPDELKSLMGLYAAQSRHWDFPLVPRTDPLVTPNYILSFTERHYAVRSWSSRTSGLSHLDWTDGKVNEKDVLDWTPFHYATLSIDAAVVEFLMKKGAAINAVDLRGRTPLHYAAYKGTMSLTILRALIRNGAYVNSRDFEGITPLHFAAAWGDGNVANVLVDAGANAHLQDIYGLSPLHYAITMNTGGSWTQLDLVETLVRSAGTDIVHAKTRRDWTPLHLAVRKGNEAITTFLIDQGADVHARTNDGWTPLHIAADQGNIALATLLITKGAAVDARNNEGSTPLHLAAFHDNAAMAQLLLRNGAYRHAKTNDKRWTPLHIAAFRHYDSAVVKLLISNHADVNATGLRNERPLCLAVQNCQYSTASYLLEHGADMTFKTVSDGWTLVHAAVRSERDVAVKLLIRAGADREAQDMEGRRPLHLALLALHGLPILRYLVDGALVNLEAVDYSQRTALHFAVMNRRLPKLLYLLDKYERLCQPRTPGPIQFHRSNEVDHFNDDSDDEDWGYSDKEAVTGSVEIQPGRLRHWACYFCRKGKTSRERIFCSPRLLKRHLEAERHGLTREEIDYYCAGFAEFRRARDGDETTGTAVEEEEETEDGHEEAMMESEEEGEGAGDHEQTAMGLLRVGTQDEPAELPG